MNTVSVLALSIGLFLALGGVAFFFLTRPAPVALAIDEDPPLPPSVPQIVVIVPSPPLSPSPSLHSFLSVSDSPNHLQVPPNRFVSRPQLDRVDVPLASQAAPVASSSELSLNVADESLDDDFSYIPFDDLEDFSTDHIPPFVPYKVDADDPYS